MNDKDENNSKKEAVRRFIGACEKFKRDIDYEGLLKRRIARAELLKVKSE